MKSTDEVYGLLVCDGALKCYGSIAWRNSTWQRATWRACAYKSVV